MTKSSKLIKVRIKRINSIDGTKEFIEGKLESNIIDSFYTDGQGWILLNGTDPITIYKFDIEKIYVNDDSITIDKDMLKKNLDPIYNFDYNSEMAEI